MGRLVLVLLGEGAATAFGLGGAGCGFGSRGGSHFHFVAGGRALGSAGGWLSSSWGSHLVAGGFAGVGAAAGAGFDGTRCSVATTCAAACCFAGTRCSVTTTGAAACGFAMVVSVVLAGLAAGKEAHGRESDDGEDLHWFILSEIGRAKHGPTLSLGFQIVRESGVRGD